LVVGISLAFIALNWNDLKVHIEEGYMKDLNDRGLENQVKGTAKEMKGQVRGDLGDLTDNESEHIKGRKQELEGKIQKNFGKAERKLDPDNDNI
jgi:uncharacterized protein YjbJ (UPF0337 family)